MAHYSQTISCLLLAIFLACGDAAIKVISPNGQVRKGLTIPPENTAALVGDTIIFKCEVDPIPPDSRVLWTEYITFAQGAAISDNEFLLNHPNRLRYAIVHNSLNQYDLQISNLQITDGGRYACEDSMSGPPDITRMEVELIVLESEPNCTSTAPADGVVVEKQNHTIECTVNYQGRYAPVMTWTGPDPFLVATSTNPPTVWSGVAYTVNRDMTHRWFECQTNFTDPGPQPGGVADNAPKFNATFVAPVIRVRWGPQGTYADPIKPFYIVGDTLTCYTDAYPEASYRWQNMRTLEEFPGQTFTFTFDLSGTNQTMRCQVQNTINGFIYSDNFFVPAPVPIATTPPTPATTPEPTPPPLESNCFDFTGFWRSDEPFGELLLQMEPDGQIGEIAGIFRNQSDTIWIEVIGTARRADWSYIGLSAIWPLNDGVTGISGECHRCMGVEEILGDGMVRAITQSPDCGVGSAPRVYEPFRFHRISTMSAAVAAQGPVSVFKPTKIAKRLGLQLK